MIPAARAARPVQSVPSERGDSLIELMISITIMAIAVVAIVGGIATSIMMSDIHRKQATAGSYVRSYASAVQDAVAGGAYGSICSTTVQPAGLPTGYLAKIVSCAPDSAYVNLTKMTLQVASTDGRDTEQLQIVVRRPCVAPTVAGQNLDASCT
jgi:Tfp pilus assembly protein PilV